MKEVAKSLTGIMLNPVMEKILDRSIDILPTAYDVIDWWRLDIYNRKPAPAVIDDKYQGTDLDLSTLLITLADRRAVINIPTYKSMRGSSIKDGQLLISKENRHGKIYGLTSNKEVFTFGVRIKDMNVISTDYVGDFRTFNITDIDGSWYSGWKDLLFIPTEDENDFIKKFQLEYGNKITFSYFVHPARKNSIYGAPYFITKVLIDRLTKEAKYLKAIIDDMLSLGIKYPSNGGIVKSCPESSKVNNEKSVTVRAFEIETDILFKNEFIKYRYDSQTLKDITKRRKDIIYRIKPILSFAARSCEYAFVFYGNGDMPAWIKDARWESEYTLPKVLSISQSIINKYNKNSVLKMLCGRRFNNANDLRDIYNYYNIRLMPKSSLLRNITHSSLIDTIIEETKPTAGRKKWDRLVLCQPEIGKLGVSIRKRVYEKSEQVSESYGG